MVVDGEKLRSLRARKGISQERLGILSNLNRRTVQRAERGQAIAPESLAFIAEALEVEPGSLRAFEQSAVSEVEQPQTIRDGEVILVPITRGSRLVNLLRSAFFAKFEYEAEVTEANLPDLEELASVFNGAWADPWELNSGCSDAELLRFQAKANRLLPALAEQGVRVFGAAYPSMQKRPRYDMDEGQMYISGRMNSEDVTNAVIVVSDETTGYLSRMPSDYFDPLDIPF